MSDFADVGNAPLKHFACILEQLPVAPLLAASEADPSLWDDALASLRRRYPGSAHHDVDAILLRWCYPVTPERLFTDLRALDYPAAWLLKEHVAPLLDPLLHAIDAGSLGRIMLARLAPAGRIDPHVDEGAYADYYSRFHVVLQSDDGNRFDAGDESVWMRPGGAWWFDHKQRHAVVNASARPRIHLIVDAVSDVYRSRTLQTSAKGGAEGAGCASSFSQHVEKISTRTTHSR